ncbi:ATP-binding protein [Phaeobacter sp. HF9A]|uniref:sensor histidine kinase n=1 Tax=Phaeobacter sp. HF9A TaxID=2721561 RepID=UPI00142F4DFC|nr:ATP-binding protein [Phaeobacter sp. HF9A]NIZ15535.1 histidine kinase [Phaeobacter sp. HF9A]
MSGLKVDRDQADLPQVRAHYVAALSDYVQRGREEDLSQAYDCARLALRAMVSISELSEMHFQATHQLLTADPPLSPPPQARMEEFFMEALSVYDMALRGYGENITRLTAEVQERRRIEDALRDASAELALQRDHLDQQVRERTSQLQDKLQELRQLNAQLHHANQEQAQFTYAISHDLKSPVNTISMMLELILADHAPGLDCEGLELIEAAQSTAERMSRMVNDILNYARVVGQDPVFERVDLGALSQEVLDDLRGEITSSGVELVVGTLPEVHGIPSQLRSMLQNLISNAIKFRKPGTPGRVAITAAPKPACCAAEISVSDNGIGIAPAYQTRIFSLFQRLHTYEEYVGSGIGLALCQRIAGYHHGDVQVTSEAGEGSTFTVRLWLKESDGDHET